MQSIHDGVIHSCEYCDYKATTKGNLCAHMQSVHEGIKYTCECCDYKATTKYNLLKHVKSVHNDYKSTTKNDHDEVKYSCDQSKCKEYFLT